MKRILLVAVSSSALALAAPAVASAHHGKHHHKQHGARARVLDFRTAAHPNTAPTTPTTESVGTVTSFKEGVLTITLTDGTQVSGKVTEQTEIQCTSATTESGDDDHGAGDDNHGAPPWSNGQSQGDGDEAHAAWSGDGGQQTSADEAQNNCTTEALVEKTPVRDAELKLTSQGALWDRVDLIH
jgi:hypothetical protein